MIAQAISNGYNVNELNSLTNIDKWFLIKMQNIIVHQRNLEVRTYCNTSVAKFGYVILRMAYFCEC